MLNRGRRPTMGAPGRRIDRGTSTEGAPMAHEHVRARRAAGVTLAWLGCAGLAVSMARAATWDGTAPATAGACVVSRIEVGYDIDYVAALGGYGVTGAA